jgi:exosortase
MRNAISIGPVKLPPLSEVNWVKVALGVAILGLVWYAYFVQVAEQSFGYRASSYRWLVGHWSNVSDYSHGPLIPLIALGIVWWKRQELFGARIEPVRWGVGVVAAAMAIYYLGIKAMQPRVAVFSFIVLLYGLILALAGRAVSRVLLFPVAFLLLMIPLNFLEERVGVPLRHLMTGASAGVLNFLGVETIRVGTALYSPTGLFQLDVAAPCSGIRSLMALTTVTAAYGYVTQRSQWKRWVLFLSAMPLAVLGNMARVSSIAIVAHVYGQKIATKEYHDAAGFIVYAVALTAMLVIGVLLNLPYRRIWESWMRPVSKPNTTTETEKPLASVSARDDL